MKDLFDILVWSVAVVSVLTAFLVIFKFRKFTDYLQYYIFWLINGAFMEILSMILAFYGITNLFVFHLNALTEFSILVLFFNALFTEKNGKGIRLVLYPGISLILLNSVFIQPPDTINSYPLTLISFGTMLIAIFYFIKLTDIEMSLDNKLFRTILVGSVFIMHGTSLFPLLFGNYLMVNFDWNSQMMVWLVRASVIMIVKLIIFYTLLSHVSYGHALND